MGIFFAKSAATDARLLKRSVESLIGICTGILADGKLSDEEIIFLSEWLCSNQELAQTWPGEVLFKRIQWALEDGIIQPEDRKHLEETITALIGGDIQDAGPTPGLATTLPTDEAQNVVVRGRAFCFTGQFLFGTRRACIRATEQLGGRDASSVTKKLDYLVIGTMASRDWANTSHGRKIEKAVKYRDSGSGIAIIDEANWASALN